jgi:hypothetical protein
VAAYRGDFYWMMGLMTCLFHYGFLWISSGNRFYFISDCSTPISVGHTGQEHCCDGPSMTA